MKNIAAEFFWRLCLFCDFLEKTIDKSIVFIYNETRKTG